MRAPVVPGQFGWPLQRAMRKKHCPQTSETGEPTRARRCEPGITHSNRRRTTEFTWTMTLAIAEVARVYCVCLTSLSAQVEDATAPLSAHACKAHEIEVGLDASSAMIFELGTRTLRHCAWCRT